MSNERMSAGFLGSGHPVDVERVIVARTMSTWIVLLWGLLLLFYWFRG